MSELRVRNSNRFGIVPDKVLEDTRLSLETRAVAAWLCGRQDGFTVRVEAMRKTYLGIGEKRWSGIRKELEAVGWWRSSRTATGFRGRFVWSHEFSIDGFADAAPAGQGADLTIPPSGMDAQSGHAGSRHAKGGDNHKDVHQQELTNSKPPPSKPEVGGGGGESKGSIPENLDELVEAAYWQAITAGTVMTNPSGWRFTTRKRLKQGANADDLLTLEQWRAAKAAAAQRERAAAERLEAERKAQAEADEFRKSGNSQAGLDACFSILNSRAAA